MIQLAATMKAAGRPCEITYLDLSGAARQVAAARAEVRGLAGISFVTGNLLDAPGLGRFDYIDCCGVLHHLPDPAAGFAALRAALAPGGGMGFMVYAPHGRAGVYPLQEAVSILLAGLAPAERLAAGRAILAQVPDGHPFRRNPHLVDHLASDAGFYDLLLHAQDRAFGVAPLVEVLRQTGWSDPSFCQPALYDLSVFAPVPKGIDAVTAMAVAEKLRGTIKTHVAYVRAAGEATQPGGIDRIPHLRDIPAAALSRAVAAGRVPPLRLGPVTVQPVLPRAAAPLLAAVDGRRSLAEIGLRVRMTPEACGALWAEVEAALLGWGVLHYSRFLV